MRCEYCLDFYGKEICHKFGVESLDLPVANALRLAYEMARSKDYPGLPDLKKRLIAAVTAAHSAFHDAAGLPPGFFR